MAKEIEAKFINIDKDKIEKRLIQIGAEKIFSERLLRRCVYNLPIFQKGAWVRVRDEIDKITMTYKRVVEESLSGVDEVELNVDDFDKAREFLKSIGFKEKAYQETKRIRYLMKPELVEFDVDTWPGLNPWIEIEAKEEYLVKKYAKLLGFRWEHAMFGSADIIYAKIFNITKDWINNDCPNLIFDNLPLQLQPSNKRKKD